MVTETPQAKPSQKCLWLPSSAGP